MLFCAEINQIQKGIHELIKLIHYRQVAYSQGEKFAKEQKILFFEVSAKSGANIENMFYSAIAELNFFSQFEWQNKEKLVEELSKIIYLILFKVNVNKGGELEKFPNDLSKVLNMQNMDVVFNQREEKRVKGCNC